MLQRVDGVMDAHVCSCTYVCVCIWVWVYIYVHLFAVSVTCTLEQVFWTLVHGQVCTLHRCVFTPTYTSANTLIFSPYRSLSCNKLFSLSLSLMTQRQLRSNDKDDTKQGTEAGTVQGSCHGLLMHAQNRITVP